jgi:hypothetical protein
MDAGTIYLLIGLWIVMLAVSYFAAQSKGRNTNDALLTTFLLGPIGVLIVLFSKPAVVIQDSPQSPQPIREPTASAMLSQPARPAVGPIYQCPHCSHPIAADARFCPNCGGRLTTEPIPTPVIAAPPVTRSGLRPLEVLLVLLIVAALGAFGWIATHNGKPQPIAAVLPTSTLTTRVPELVFSTPPPVTPPPDTALPGDTVFELGQAVTISNSTGVLGTITVITSKRYTSLDEFQVAGKGKLWVGVELRYAATAPMSYSPFSWAAHDAAGSQYEYVARDVDPSLDSGDLGAGRNRTGWISFEVPKTTAHLWVDYKNYDGSVIFTVKLY